MFNRSFPNDAGAHRGDRPEHRPLSGVRAGANMVLASRISPARILPDRSQRPASATAVASDGRYLAVADTANNRVLIWNEIPTQNGQPADMVIWASRISYRPDRCRPVNASSLRAPQGVWIQNGKLYGRRHAEQSRPDLEYDSHQEQSAGRPGVGRAQFHDRRRTSDQTNNAVIAAANTMLNPDFGDQRRSAFVRRRSGLQPRPDLEHHSDRERSGGRRRDRPAGYGHRNRER